LQVILDLIIVPNPTIYISSLKWNVSVLLMQYVGIFAAMRCSKEPPSRGRS
jgi:hypothetical protein